MELAELFVKLRTDTHGFNRAMDGVHRRLKNTAQRMERFSRNAQRLFLGLGATITATVFSAASAADIDEKFKVVFGAAAGEVDDFAKSLAKSLGRSKIATKEALGNFQDLLKPIGFSNAAAAALSKNLIALSYDLAAFNKIPDKQVFEIIKSGLSGSNEVFKRFGVVIDEAKIKTKAYQLGIAETGSQLNDVQKSLARYSLLIAGTTDAQGTAAKRLNDFSGQWVRLKSQILDTSVIIGKLFLPVASNFLKAINEIIPKIVAWIGEHKTLVKFLSLTSLGIAGLVGSMAPLLVSLASLAYLIKIIVGSALALFVVENTRQIKRLSGVVDSVTTKSLTKFGKIVTRLTLYLGVLIGTLAAARFAFRSYFKDTAEDAQKHWDITINNIEKSLKSSGIFWGKLFVKVPRSIIRTTREKLSFLNPLTDKLLKGPNDKLDKTINYLNKKAKDLRKNLSKQITLEKLQGEEKDKIDQQKDLNSFEVDYKKLLGDIKNRLNGVNDELEKIDKIEPFSKMNDSVEKLTKSVSDLRVQSSLLNQNFSDNIRKRATQIALSYQKDLDKKTNLEQNRFFEPLANIKNVIPNLANKIKPLIEKFTPKDAKRKKLYGINSVEGTKLYDILGIGGYSQSGILDDFRWKMYNYQQLFDIPRGSYEPSVNPKDAKRINSVEGTKLYDILGIGGYSQSEILDDFRRKMHNYKQLFEPPHGSSVNPDFSFTQYSQVTKKNTSSLDNLTNAIQNVLTNQFTFGN